jgi:hypothetical protein
MKAGRLVMIDWDGVLRPRRNVIFELHAAGVPTADIARQLGVIYQIVSTTLAGTGRPTTEPAPQPQAVHLDIGPVDAALLGCVKTKDSRPRPAKDLYLSPLFRGRRGYAEASGRPWWIVSAEYGLVDPDEVIAPYDTQIGQRSLADRQALAAQVAARLTNALGTLQGKVLELHAGDEYALAIGPTLRLHGAELVRPLHGLGFGEQLAWYGKRLGLIPGVHASVSASRSTRPARSTRPVRPEPTEAVGEGRGVGRRITELFLAGQLDLSARSTAPRAGWDGMPEVVAARRLRELGADDVAVRRFLTFNAAMDRAREADRLAIAAASLYRTSAWVFDPIEVSRRSLLELTDELRSSRVSQRHGQDAFGWRLLAETLADPTAAPEARSAIYDGVADAGRLLAELERTTSRGTRLFPLLGGPKIGPLWVRLLVYPGGAQISNLAIVPVAVDVQVRRVTEYLGVTDTAGRDLEEVRGLIQRTWAKDVAEHGAAGPDVLRDTPGALDPALWFYAKWGCSFCERAHEQLSISAVCQECRFGQL